MPKRIPTTCETCEAEFKTRTDRPQRFCCRDCWNRRDRSIKRPPVKRVRLADPVPCKTCGEPFVRRLAFIKYCDACRATWKCKRCGEQLKMAEQNFCGFHCRSRYMAETGQMPLEAMAEGRRNGKRNGKRSSVPLYIPPRACIACGTTYAPRSTQQRRCKTCSPNRTVQALARRYGLTAQQLRDLRDSQDNQCAICFRDLPPHGQGRGAVIDHCHDTGRVRGLLCISCNGRLSGLEDLVWREKALNYLGETNGET